MYSYRKNPGKIQREKSAAKVKKKAYIKEIIQK